jgi:hypothetical protein
MREHHDILHPQVKERVVESRGDRGFVKPGKVPDVPQNKELSGAGVEQLLRDDPAVRTGDDERMRTLSSGERTVLVEVDRRKKAGISIKNPAHGIQTPFHMESIEANRRALRACSSNGALCSRKEHISSPFVQPTRA